MNVKRKKTARKIQRTRTRVQGAPPSQPDLDVVSRALLGLGEWRGAPDAQAEGSIEDPLGDWPESSGEPDQWLLERREHDKEPQEI